MNLNTVFFIGPQGSGKGTQAKILAEKLGFFYWEMGGILRKVAKESSALGGQVMRMINNGILLPDELLFQVLESRLSQISKDQGVIFDGIPRRVGQAEFLINFLKQQGRKNFTTIFMDIPRDASINRLLLRARKENRIDDTREMIEKRLKQYYEATVPVVDFLKQQTRLIEIDGLPDVAEVTQSINQKLEVHA